MCSWEYTSIWALKHPNTHTSNLPISLIFKHNCQSIWAHVRSTTVSVMPLSLLTFHEYCVGICVWILNMWISMHVGMQSSKHLNIWAGNHQSIQLSKNECIQVSGHVNIKARWHVSILSSKQKQMWVDYQQRHTSMWSWEHTCIWAFKHPTTHISNLLIISAFRKNCQLIWAYKRPTTISI